MSHVPSARVLLERGGLVASRDLCQLRNMSAFKRKRGGQTQADKRAKKVKNVAGEGEASGEVEQEKNNEITIPAPVSSVSANACYELQRYSAS